MKIVYIDTMFPTVGTFVAGEIIRMKRRGIKIYIFPLMNDKSAKMSSDYKEISSDIYYLPYILSVELWIAWLYWMLNFPGRVFMILADVLTKYSKEPINFLKLLVALPKIGMIAYRVQKLKVDLVHGNWAHYPGTAAYIISMLTNIPYSFSAHAGADIYITQVMLKEKLKKAEFVLTCTGANMDYLRNLSANNAERIKLCYHGIDIAKFKFQINSQKAKKPILLSVGRLVDSKGFHIMIKSAALLRQRGVEFQYIIIGEGKYNDQLRNLIKQLKVEDCVELRSFMPQEELLNIYSNATLFVMPSLLGSNAGRDGIPNVLLEAMAMGVPVVATNFSGIPEAIEDGVNGILVEPGESEQLAEAVWHFLACDNKKRKQITHNARRKVEEMFDVERCFEKVYDIFMTTIRQLRDRIRK